MKQKSKAKFKFQQEPSAGAGARGGMLGEMLRRGGMGALDSDNRAEVFKLKLSKIHPDPNQPRKTFDPAKHAELVESLRNDGVLQPIMVRKHPELEGEYLIVYGERRVRASKELGIEKIKASITDKTDPKDILALQLIENMLRDDLTLMDEVHALTSLREIQGSNKAVAARLGIPENRVGQILQIAEAPPEVIAIIAEGRTADPQLVSSMVKLFKKDPARFRAMTSGGKLPTATTVRQALGVSTDHKPAKPGSRVTRLLVKVGSKHGSVILKTLKKPGETLLVTFDGDAKPTEVKTADKDIFILKLA